MCLLRRLPRGITNTALTFYAYCKLNDAALFFLASDTNISFPTFDNYNELKLGLRYIKNIL